ncbi:hypothetical protein J3A83DRAFT_4190611 [Scleroderma citrinum]
MADFCRHCYTERRGIPIPTVDPVTVKIDTDELTELGRAFLQKQLQIRKTKIESLVRHCNELPIYRLPNEILLEIIQFSIRATVLARPSCDRDLMLGTVTLWTTIKVDYAWGKSLTTAYLQRSQQYHLDIEIRTWDDYRRVERNRFTAVFDMLTPHAHRWRSILLHDADGFCVPHELPLPSIKQVLLPYILSTVKPLQEVACGPRFLRPGSSPSLEHLQVANRVLLPPSDSPVWQKLTILSLSDQINTSEPLLSNSIQLPLPEKLECNISHPRAFLHAIVAPRLWHFTYGDHHHSMNSPPSEVFLGLDDKFSGVTHLVWIVTHDPTKVFLTFPGVRHMKLAFFDAKTVFRSSFDSDAKYLPHLRSLAVGETTSSLESLAHNIAAWLKHRQCIGIERIRYSCTWKCLNLVHKALREHCELEFPQAEVNNVHMTISATPSGSLKLKISPETLRWMNMLRPSQDRYGSEGTSIPNQMPDLLYDLDGGFAADKEVNYGCKESLYDEEDSTWW